MIESQSYSQLKQEIVECIAADRGLLEQLRDEIRLLRSEIRPIYTRNATSMSLVATDGGNISLRFDPFLVQIIRIVDSSNREYCLEAVTPTTKISALSAKQFHPDGTPRTALGAMMAYLGVRDLRTLSPRIRNNEDGKPISPGWVQVYRELVEWASLFSIIRTNDFATDTLIIVDGLLRSIIFADGLFNTYWQGIKEGIELQRRNKHRKIFLAGVAKHSKVLEEYLKYKVNIRILGVLRHNNGKLAFVASHRRLPHVGSHVAFPSDQVLQEITGHNLVGAEIGHFALGEYIYSAGSNSTKVEDWMQIKSPEINIKFPVQSLVSRRSFIFARAGFGKSNLNKLLFSKLYAQTPTVTKRGNREIPVGTVIFDRDGEYFWPDDKGRPGLCDVPVLQDKLVVFTPRKAPSPFYSSFVAGGIKLDIRRLSPSDVISIALSPERQEQQNVRKLRGLTQRNWEKLVNLIDQGGNQTLLDEISTLIGLESRQQEVEALAARGNMTTIVHMLHDKSSQFMDMLIYALSEGKLCIVDVSQMRGAQALVLSGLVLRRIFDRNQKEFTEAEPKTIPTIAVIEEAQSALNERASAAEPYIAWVKEGRKYDLGALLITQQPGSIPMDILSQGDNWFIFHLLSTTDLTNVQRANAHFSEDILSVLLNEPIPGQGIFWSSVGGTPYPVSIRVLSFEHMYTPLDPQYTEAAVDTFAHTLKDKFQHTLSDILEHQTAFSLTNEGETTSDNTMEGETVDTLAVYKNNAIVTLRNNNDIMAQLQGRGIPWGVVFRKLAEKLPDTLEDRDDVAHILVVEALEQIFGPKEEAWHSFKHIGLKRKTNYLG